MTLSEIIIEMEEVESGESLTLPRLYEAICFLKKMEENAKKSSEWYQKIVRAHSDDRERAEEKLKAIRAVLISAGCSDYTDDLPKMVEDFLGALAQNIRETEQELIAVKAALSEVETDRALLQQQISDALDAAGIPSGVGNGAIWTPTVRINAFIVQALLDRRNIERLTGGKK